MICPDCNREMRVAHCCDGRQTKRYTCPQCGKVEYVHRSYYGLTIHDHTTKHK